MTIPAVLLGFLLSTLLAACFHLIFGGGAAHFLFYLILSWLGFWSGNFLGDYLGWSFVSIGPINLGFATMGCGICLIFGRWLSRVEPQEKE